MTGRRRVARPRGTVALSAAAVLGIVAVAAVSLTAGRAGDSAPEAIPQFYVTSAGEVCHLDIVPRIDGTDLGGYLAVLAEVARVDTQSLHIASHLPRTLQGTPTADQELDAVAVALGRHAERLLAGRGTATGRVHVDIAYDCRPPVRVGLEGPLSSWGWRPADGGGLFRASTGEVCEVQWWVEQDPLLADDGSLAIARAHLASTDPATVHAAVISSELDVTVSSSYSTAEAEALTVGQTVMFAMIETVAPDYPLSYGLQARFQMECR